jgi:hypothetical protein
VDGSLKSIAFCPGCNVNAILFKFFIIINNEDTEMLIYPSFSLGLALIRNKLNDEPFAPVYNHPVLFFYPDGDLTDCFQTCT